MMNPGVSVAVVRNEGQTTNKRSIPYIIDGTAPFEEGAGLSSDSIVRRFGSELLKQKVVPSNPRERYVVTNAGTRIGYEKLIFATGSEEAILPIRLPGRQSAGGGR